MQVYVQTRLVALRRLATYLIFISDRSSRAKQHLSDFLMTQHSSIMHRSPSILYKYHTERTDSSVLEARTTLTSNHDRGRYYNKIEIELKT